jgi:hypothetical protein
MKTIPPDDKKVPERVCPEPLQDTVPVNDREIAKRRLLERLDQQTSLGVRNWRRDELYEN